MIKKSGFHKQHKIVPARWQKSAKANPFEAALHSPQRLTKYYKAMVEHMKRSSREKG